MLQYQENDGENPYTTQQAEITRQPRLGPFGNAGFYVGNIGYITAKITETGGLSPPAPF